jgi:short-subunit dehydrogenase
MQISTCRALITGASGGIGQALVSAMCQRGAHVLVAGRQLPPLQQLGERFPGQVEVVQADIGTAPGRDAVLLAAQRFGGVNCLINAAGVNRFGLLEQHDDEAIAEILGVNVASTLQLTRRLLPELLHRERALVVNLGSTFGSIGYPGFTAYCASKFALRGFSEALRRELADTRIDVLYVAPRAARTSMNEAHVVAMNKELKVAMDDPAVVAASVVNAIGNERRELFLGWPEKLFVRINSLLPRVVDQALKKQLPVIKRFARTRT